MSGDFEHKPYTVGFSVDRIQRAAMLGRREVLDAMMMARLDHLCDEAIEELQRTIYGKPKIIVVAR